MVSYFLENNTFYTVTEYIEVRSVKNYLWYNKALPMKLTEAVEMLYLKCFSFITSSQGVI